MSKWFEVRIETSEVYAVEVEDIESETEAKEYALQFAPNNGEVVSCEAVTGKRKIDASTRHADFVLRIDK